MGFKLRRLLELVKYYIFYLYGLLFNKKINIFDFFDISKYQDKLFIDNDYRVKNNKWGTFKISDSKKKDYKQLIKKDGWILNTPYKNYGVIGYPSLIYDYKKIKISNILNHGVYYNFDLYKEKNKKYNLSFDFWINSKNKFDFKTMTNEIMIWEDYFVSHPFGKFHSEVKVNGQVYRVYEGFIDKSSENLGTKGWNYICFLKVSRTNGNTVDVSKFLDYLIKSELIDENNYLVRSEIGTEVYNGSLRLNVDEFDYRIDEKVK